MNTPRKLRVTLAADAHIDINHSKPEIPMFFLRRALSNAKKLKSDAFVILGDTTSHGIRANWDLTRSCFEKIKHCAEHILLVIGNHDCWGDGDDEYACCFAEYSAGCRDIAGISPDKPYFSAEIGGYRLICLGNESERGCDADITDTQLAWLSDELAEATEDGKPAFVFCHQSLNGRHGLPRTWEEEEDPTLLPDEGGVGEASEKIEAILKSHKNVFYFSGHSHMGLAGEATRKEKGYSSFEEEDGLHLINLPSLACGNHGGEVNNVCVGMVLDVYEEKVVLRLRDFREGRYIQSVSVRDGKPYYEVFLT